MPSRHPVILTRPAGRNETLAHCLQAQGCLTLALPALAIVPLPAPVATLPLPGDYDLVIVVSGTAARAYADQLRRVALLKQWPADVPIACVGPATAAAMHGKFWPEALRILHPDTGASSHDSEALWRVLVHSDLPLRRVLLVRGVVGREWLAQRLIQLGVVVDRHAVYARQPADWPDSARRTLVRWRDAGQTPVWLVTSGEGLDAVYRNIVQFGMQSWWRSHRFVVPHPRLAARLSALMAWTEEVQRAMVKISLPQEADLAQALLSLCLEPS